MKVQHTIQRTLEFYGEEPYVFFFCVRRQYQQRQIPKASLSGENAYTDVYCRGILSEYCWSSWNSSRENGMSTVSQGYLCGVRQVPCEKSVRLSRLSRR